MTTGPTPARDRLADRVAAGGAVDLIGGPDGDDLPCLDEVTMRRWGPEHDLGADELSQLVNRRGSTAGAAFPHGVHLRGVRVSGRLTLDFLTDAWPLTLVDCLLDHGISARVAHLPRLELRRCRVTRPAGVPIDLSGSEVDHEVGIDGCVVTAAEGAACAVDLTDARISHTLHFRGTDVVNRFGTAIDADRCDVGGSMSLTGGCRLLGSGADAAVRLMGSTVTGQLNARGARIENRSGPALAADRCTIGGSLVLTGGFHGEGNSRRGALRLPGARIAGQPNGRGAHLTNPSGPALTADRCTVGDVLLKGRFRASGGGERAVVRLFGARISGQLDADGARLSGAGSGALDLRQAAVDGPVILAGDFVAEGAGEAAVVDLSGASLGQLQVNDRVTHRTDATRRWVFDRCTYSGLPTPVDAEWWLDTFTAATPAHAAQPYRQLADAHRSAGNDRQVRSILIAQRDAGIDRGCPGVWERAWAWITKTTLGYGWKPWRALYGLLGVFAVSAVLAVVLGGADGHGALVHPSRPDRGPEGCTVVERVGVGLDLGTPLISSATKSRDRCLVNPDPVNGRATALLISTWALQVLAWGAAALFVAGFTGAVRKT